VRTSVKSPVDLARTSPLFSFGRMTAARNTVLVAASVAFGCYAPPDPIPARSARTPERTGLSFQAVDAGTGSALQDAQMTVRYLIRAPIAYDQTAVDRVSSVDAYAIDEMVGEDELVVEVRLEAPSYYRLDTVLAVPRGETAGPLTMRLSRRLDQVAQAPTGRPARRESATPPPATQSSATLDRSAMVAGDRAFEAGDWFAATEAYQGMPSPTDPTDAYGRDYAEARLRHGIAHVNRSEFGQALEILDEAAGLPDASPQAYLRLSQAQCAVGRTEEGRGTLAQLSRTTNRMLPDEQAYVNAMISYRRGVCSQGEFDRAEGQRDRVSTGAAAIRELNAFIEEAGAMSSAPADISAAVQDAEQRVQQIRTGMRG
jgi:hypothetical protein